MQCKFTVLKRDGQYVDREWMTGELVDVPETGLPVIIYKDSFSPWLIGMALRTANVSLIGDIDDGWMIGTVNGDLYKIELLLEEGA